MHDPDLSFDRPAPLLIARGISLKLGGQVILDDISLDIFPGEQWAIAGSSGSGKTSLAKAIAGMLFTQGAVSRCFPPFGEFPGTRPGSSRNASFSGSGIAFIGQQHHFRNRSNTDSFYYQQRYNSMDSGDSETVGEVMGRVAPGDAGTQLLDDWGLGDMTGKPLIQLSNGENKRLQLAVALSADPFLVILDSPFTGLDAGGRETLARNIDVLAASGKLVLLIGRVADLPQRITHLVVLDQGRVVYKGLVKDYTRSEQGPVEIDPRITAILQGLKSETDDVPESVNMQDVSVRYAERTILDKVNWVVRKGECWSVSGGNGAGKSTLLSLITADNPQAYSNRIHLFGRRRGTGESIWDIKRNIGYVSPELHLSFERGNSVFEVIGSGLFDTIGLFRQLADHQVKQVENMLILLGLDEIKGKPLFQLPLGQQRLALLARALVKNPPMLILDEPCQGLDEDQSARIRSMIDLLCETTGCTLIYVSHYLSDIPRCVTKHLVLENARARIL